MRVVAAPPIQFKCDACGAVNEGEAHEFLPLHTMPPSFRARCAFCRCETTCFPRALVARVAGDAIDGLGLGIVGERSVKAVYDAVVIDDESDRR